MSLVDVRGSSDTSGPGPGAGAGPGAGSGCAGRGPLSPPSSPLSSPLDSPLGSPLGAVSLDAAVFVAKGGLNAAMLDDSDPRADSFADDFLQTGSQLMELWACGKSFDGASSPYPSDTPFEPSTPASPAEDADSGTSSADTYISMPSSGKGMSSKRTRASQRECRSAARDAPPETRSTRKNVSDVRETRSTAAKEVTPAAEAVQVAQETRVTRVTRSTRRNTVPAEAAEPPLPPPPPSGTPTPTTSPSAPLTSLLSAAPAPALPTASTTASTTTDDVTPMSPPSSPTPRTLAPSAPNPVSEEGTPESSGEARAIAASCGAADAKSEQSHENMAGDEELSDETAPGEQSAGANGEALATPTTPPAACTALVTPPPPTTQTDPTAAVETALMSTAEASTESTTSTPPAVTPTSAALAPTGAVAVTTPTAVEGAGQETLACSPTDCTPSPGSDAICAAAGTLPSLGATPRSAGSGVAALEAAGDGANAISGDAAAPQRSAQPVEQKPPASGVLAAIIAAKSTTPSPAHRFLPSMVLPRTRLMSTEVTDALGRKTCLLPSLPRKAKTTPTCSTVSPGGLPGGILSRALTGGLPVKLPPAPLPQTSDCITAIDLSAQSGARGSSMASMGILARTLSAPDDLLSSSAPSEGPFRLTTVTASPVMMSTTTTAAPPTTCSPLYSISSTVTPAFATFATRMTTVGLTATPLPPTLASFTLMAAQPTTTAVPALSKTILLNPILSKALAPAGQPPHCGPRPLAVTHPTAEMARPPAVLERSASLPETGHAAMSEQSTAAAMSETEQSTVVSEAPATTAMSEAVASTASSEAAATTALCEAAATTALSEAAATTALSEAAATTALSEAAATTASSEATSTACLQWSSVRSDMGSQTSQPDRPDLDAGTACPPQADPSDSGHPPRSCPRSINTTPASNTFASTPSLAKQASLRDEEGDTAVKTGLSDSCASSSSLSTATSPGLSCAPYVPCVPSALGLDSIAAPEPASAAPLFTDSPDDLLDVADALNVLSAVDDDAVGSSQDSTQLSGGSNSSISSCCSGTSSCSGASNCSTNSSGSCCGGSRQRPRAASPSRLGPQQCQVCSKVFSNASALAKHKLTHSDERRYVCTVCNKAFKRQDHLNGHMLTHRNKKPYECVLEGCNKSYCDARSLRRHEENHHHVKPPPGCKEREVEKPKEKEVKKKCPKSTLTLITPTGESILADNGGKSLDGLSESNDTQDSTCQLSTPSVPSSTASPLPEGCTAFTLPKATENVPDSPKASKKPLQKNSGSAIPNSTVLKAGGPLVTSTASSASAMQSSAQCGLVLTSTTTSVVLTPAVQVQTAVTSQLQHSPIRVPQVPPPSPITIPSLRPQLFTTRAVSANTPVTQQAVQHISQSSDQYGQLRDQSIPQALTLAPSRQNSQGNVVHSNFSSSFLPTSQQLPVVQLSISQPSTALMSVNHAVQSALPQNQQLVAQAACNKLQTVQGLQSQPLIALSKSENQLPKALPTTWTHMVVTSTSNHLPLSSSLKNSGLQLPGSVLVTQGRGISLQRQAAIDSSVETYQPQFNGSQHMPAVHAQPSVSGTVSSVQINSTAAGEQPFLTLKRVMGEQQMESIPNLMEAKECVPDSVQKPPNRIINSQQKKSQSKAGLVNEISAASTSSCTPVSTPTSTTTTTTASTFALTLTSSKATSVPSLITSNGSIKTSTYTSSSGISSCKVSSTAHLGSVRDIQAISGTQQSRQASLSPQDEAKKDAKAAAAAANSVQSKPVACTLCNRRFKNIPALNGHMRLHGGFFKKESEAKRADKRESTGPPLQTASVSVRQLIEEKIIQKRGGAIGRAALLAGRDCSVSSSSSLTNSSATTTSAISNTNSVSTSLVPNREAVERRRHSEHQESPLRKVPMTSDSATTVLQHHNYANNSFPTPPPSSNVSNANSPPPPSPLTCTSFLPLSPQSDGSEPHQLLIHSEDPLLSSTIKDITRKKIDLGSLTVLGSVLVERGGELHLIQAPTAIMHKLSSRNTKQKQAALDTPVSFSLSVAQNMTTSTSGSSYHSSSSFFKTDDIEDEVFLSPSIVPDSPLSLNSPVGGFSATTRSPLGPTSTISGLSLTVGQSCNLSAPPAKRPRLSKPYPAYKSRLRSCRREAICSASMPYTPAPMLDPNRTGNGLIAHAGSPWHCSSTTTDGEDSCDAMAISAPESDSFPHVNVGTRFQCPIPPCERKPYDPSTQDYRLWGPAVTSKCTDAEVDSYLEFACCDAILWGGRNQEYALHVLQMCDGDVQEAMVQLMLRNPTLPPEHLLLSYNYGITDLWNVDEMDSFVTALTKHAKNWAVVAKEVVTKNEKECVQFYYLWKKLCPDEYNNVKYAWKTQEKVGDDMNNNLNIQQDAHSKEFSIMPNQNDTSCTQPMALLHANTASELAALFPSSSDVEEILNLNRPSETISDESLKAEKCEGFAKESNQNDELFKCRSSLAAERIPESNCLTKEERFFAVQDLDKSDALLQSLPGTGVEMSGTCHTFTDISQNFDEGLSCLKTNEELILNHIKREPWEFCIKEEIKQELDGSNFDLTEAKNFITEFDSIKLNHVSAAVTDLNETVEDAPIIVTNADHLHNDPHDQVKMEIESMMALHGIRVEDEPTNEVFSDLNDTKQKFKAESHDHVNLKGGGYPSATDEHVSTSSDSRLFVCELTDCSASFNSRAALNGHIRIHGYRKSPPPNVCAGQRQQQRQEYPCETCGKIFAKLKSRNAHMKTHKLLSADLAETLAGRATGISSSADVPSTSSSTTTGLSFSTCLSFGLAVRDSSTLPKDVTSKESLVKSMEDRSSTNQDNRDTMFNGIKEGVESKNTAGSEQGGDSKIIENNSSPSNPTPFLALELCFNSKSPKSPTPGETFDEERTGQDVTDMVSNYLNERQNLSSTTTTFTGRVAVATTLDIANDKCRLGSKSVKSIEAQGPEKKKGLSKKLKTKSKSVSTFGSLSRSR